MLTRDHVNTRARVCVCVEVCEAEDDLGPLWLFSRPVLSEQSLANLEVARENRRFHERISRPFSRRILGNFFSEERWAENCQLSAWIKIVWATSLVLDSIFLGNRFFNLELVTFSITTHILQSRLSGLFVLLEWSFRYWNKIGGFTFTACSK